jgi:antitoxin VapB
MLKGSVFVANRTQAVRLPLEARFPVDVKSVLVRIVGAERVLTPADSSWDSFFFGPEVSNDFMSERSNQEQKEREAF